MAMLTQAMKDMVAAQQCFIGTADKNGVPNVAPKRSTRVLDDTTLAFNESTGKRTYQNLQENPHVAIAVVDREKLDGYRFVGKAELVTSGDLFDQAAAQMEKAGLRKPFAVVKVHVEEIYSLNPRTAGQRIDQ